MKWISSEKLIYLSGALKKKVLGKLSNSCFKAFLTCIERCGVAFIRYLHAYQVIGDLKDKFVD